MEIICLPESGSFGNFYCCPVCWHNKQNSWPPQNHKISILACVLWNKNHVDNVKCSIDFSLTSSFERNWKFFFRNRNFAKAKSRNVVTEECGCSDSQGFPNLNRTNIDSCLQRWWKRHTPNMSKFRQIFKELIFNAPSLPKHNISAEREIENSRS